MSVINDCYLFARRVAGRLFGQSYPEAGLPSIGDSVLQATEPPASAGSVGRPIGNVQSFLEDIKARGFVPRGMLDVGANRGDWSSMALSVFPASQAVMIEPQQEMRPYLDALCANDSRCRAFICGAGREEGELVLTIWEDTYGSSYTVPKSLKLLNEGKQRITPIRTVDNLLQELGPSFEPDLVKVDVQGFEIEVLRGGDSLFGRTDVFILETTLLVGDSPLWPSTRQVVEFMGSKGYEIYDITSFLRKPSDGSLGQIDFAFVKKEGMFRRNTEW
jgi:FkbM family methyltransferase